MLNSALALYTNLRNCYVIMQKSVSVVVLVVRNWTELGHLDHGFDDEDLYDGGDDGVDDADDTTYQQSEYLSGPDILHGTQPDTQDIS